MTVPPAASNRTSCPWTASSAWSTPTPPTGSTPGTSSRGGRRPVHPQSRRDAWLSGLDLRTRELQRIKDARRTDIQGHVLPRARGLDAPGRDDLWLFQGRHAALRTARTWLLDDGPAALVVTGDPGSGKSALLARLHVLATADLRRRVPAVHTLPDDTVPPDGSITRFVHARGMTPKT